MKHTHAGSFVSSPQSSIGQRLRRERLRLGWSQEHLAEELQTSVTSISRWERDLVLPHPHFQQHLARVFHRTVETLFLLDEPVAENLVVPELRRYWYLPHLRNPYFTGRQDILEQLHWQLQTSQRAATGQVLALCGLGGIGKTQIALEYAYQYAGDHAATFWIAAETTETIMETFASIAEILELPEQKETEQQRVVDAVQRWLTMHQGWLLVWDNVEDVDLFQRFAPKAGRGAMLLTTRRQALGTLAVGIELTPLSPQESLLFLLCRAKLLSPGASQEQVERFTQAAPAQVGAAQELVTLMDGLPLALDQVGAYIEETGCSCSDYLQQYRHRQARLLHRRGGVVSAYPHSVATTWSLSFEQVERQNPAATDVLKMCAMLHSEAIPEEIFTLGAPHLGERLAAVASDPFQFDEALSTLALYSLLRRNGEDHSLSMHRLVQAVLRARMPEQERGLWLNRAVVALNAAFPEVSYEAWRQCERLLPHVLACATANLYHTGCEELADLLCRAANYLRARTRYEHAEPLYQQALRIQEHILGPEHSRVAHSLNGLAFLYYRQGKYRQAEALLKRSLCVTKHTSGPQHLDMATPLATLAILYVDQGKYGQAEPLYQQALDIQERVLGPQHPELIGLLNNLAILSFEQEKYEQAELLYQRALHITEQALSAEHFLAAFSLNNLAELYTRQGKYDQAEALCRRALHIWEQTLGSLYHHIALPLLNLADIYARQGKYAQAEPLYKQALSIQEQTLGLEHPDLTLSLNNLATLYFEQEKYTQSEHLYRRALHLREQRLEQDHPETARSLVGLARLYEKQGKREQAEQLLQRAYVIFEQRLGQTHSETIKARNAYSCLLEQREGGCHASRAHIHVLQAHGHQHYAVPSTFSEMPRIPPAQEVETDPLADFLTACCELHSRAWSHASDLWQAYEQWAAEHQERFPLSRRAFAAHLKAHGCQPDRTGTSRIWRGIALREKNCDAK